MRPFRMARASSAWSRPIERSPSAHRRLAELDFKLLMGPLAAEVELAPIDARRPAVDGDGVAERQLVEHQYLIEIAILLGLELLAQQNAPGTLIGGLFFGAHEEGSGRDHGKKTRGGRKMAQDRHQYFLSLVLRHDRYASAGGP